MLLIADSPVVIARRSESEGADLALIDRSRSQEEQPIIARSSSPFLIADR